MKNFAKTAIAAVLIAASCTAFAQNNVLYGGGTYSNANVYDDSAATSSATAQGGNATSSNNLDLNVEGDKQRSLVAVFPPPAAASAPSAQNCIVTKSEATAIGWSLVSRATAEQSSDPVCVLMWLHTRAKTEAQADALVEKIMLQLVLK